MATVDWLVLAVTLATIVIYGVYKGRQVRTADAYLRGGSDQKWWTIGLSIMATQASAITFLSVPGQAYEEGLGFVQFYLGLPIAMVLLSALIVPVYYRLRIATAYEYLERRFDQKTRQLAAFLFLLQRGLGAGLSIYAPAIILSSVLGWPLHLTNLLLGILVIAYSVSGGTRAVSQTQTVQMLVILAGMSLALYFIVAALPSEVSLGDSLAIAGGLGKLKAIDFSLRPEARYTVWSGLFGGLFVALAYFGTDQSQVGRYLSGSSLRESRLGLLFNGLVKIPMQLGILFLGLMLFVFYQFHPAPIFFNTAELARAQKQATTPKLGQIEAEYDAVRGRTQQQVHALVLARQQGDRAAEASTLRSLRALDTQTQALRAAAKQEIKSLLPRTETKDADYVFIGYITRHFPKGLVGLLIAVILCAAMSATASALNALGSTTVVDFYRRSLRPKASDAHYLAMGKVATAFWGILATLFAAFASLLDNLIQAVNILGSLFYGPTLGVFLVGFFLPRIGGTAIFSALVIAQIAVLGTFFASSISFLWYNVIGCGLAVSIAYLLTLCGVGNVRPAPS